MGYKTISLSEKAYEMLRKMNRENESFSQVVIRLSNRKTLNDFVCCISENSLEKLVAALGTFRDERIRVWSESMEDLLGEQT
jgi:predicted CopG family antitoxin